MMKINTTLLSFLFLLLINPISALAQWKQLGGEVHNGSLSFTELVSIHDTIYVAFKDASANDRISVKKWNGSNWEHVGQAGFSSSFVDYVQIATDGNVPYVAFQDASQGNRLTVMKFETDSNKWIPLGPKGFTNSSIAHLDFIITKQGTPMVSFHDGATGGKAAVMFYQGQSWEYLGVNFGISGSSVEKTALAQKDSLVYLAVITFKNGSACTNFTLEVFEYKTRTGNWTSVYDGLDNCANEVDITFNETEPYPYLVYRKHQSFAIGEGMLLKYKGTSNQWDTLSNEPFTSIAYGYNIPANQLQLDFIDEVPVVMYREAVNSFSRPAVQYLNRASKSWKKLTGLDSISALNGAGSSSSLYFHGIVHAGTISLIHQVPQSNYNTAFVYQFKCQPEQPLIQVNDDFILSTTKTYEHYQWFNAENANNWQPIEGADSSHFRMSRSGVYGLEVKSGFCTARSQRTVLCYIYDTSTQVVNDEIQLINTPEELSYEWYNCQTNQKINGATQSTFKPTENGIYRVELITLNGDCRQAGSCIAFQLPDPTRLDEIEQNRMQVFPNPATNSLSIQHNNRFISLSIWSSTGQLLIEQTLQNGNQQDLNISGLEPGCYLIQLKNKTGHVVNQRFIKTNP